MLVGVALLDTYLPPALALTWLPLMALLLLLGGFRLIHVFQDCLLLRLCFKPCIVGKLHNN